MMGRNVYYAVWINYRGEDWIKAMYVDETEAWAAVEDYGYGGVDAWVGMAEVSVDNFVSIDSAEGKRLADEALGELTSKTAAVREP